MPVDWNLAPGPVDVTSIFLRLSILNGAVGQRESGNAIFPETLKAEFHGIRSSIEAYLRRPKSKEEKRHLRVT